MIICTNDILWVHIRITSENGLVAQLDCDQEVASPTPTGSATFLCEDLIMKYFLQSFFSFL